MQHRVSINNDPLHELSIHYYSSTLIAFKFSHTWLFLVSPLLLLFRSVETSMSLQKRKINSRSHICTPINSRFQFPPHKNARIFNLVIPCCTITTIFLERRMPNDALGVGSTWTINILPPLRSPPTTFQFAYTWTLLVSPLELLLPDTPISISMKLDLNHTNAWSAPLHSPYSRPLHPAVPRFTFTTSDVMCRRASTRVACSTVKNKYQFTFPPFAHFHHNRLLSLPIIPCFNCTIPYT